MKVILSILVLLSPFATWYSRLTSQPHVEAKNVTFCARLDPSLKQTPTASSSALLKFSQICINVSSEARTFERMRR